MSNDIFSLSINEVGMSSTHWELKVMPGNCLHYCPPSAGGWGIIRVGLLVPESALLFVAPAGCGRHGAIAGIQLGFKKRLFFLHLTEMDIITGEHMEKIPRAVKEILATVHPRPKAFLICATCIDDLLGSDYDGLAAQMEEEHKLPVRICHMDPIAMDGKTPPQLTVQEAIYDFLKHSIDKEKAVNIIGSFAPVERESELYDVMAGAGIKAVRHIAACHSMEEFLLMGSASHNILVQPGGRLAARMMEHKLKVPFCFAPAAYGLDTINRTYRKLEKFLDVQLDTAVYHREAETAIERYRKELGPLSVAVGATANAMPFEIARAMTEYGFKVKYVFADMILDLDAEHVEWLKSHAPDIKVFTNVHPTMVDFLEQGMTVDLAIGFDAGYFCSGATTVPLTLDRQQYGYRGTIALFRMMLDALENPVDHREQMYAAGTVI